MSNNQTIAPKDQSVFIGIDVAKDSLSVYISSTTENISLTNQTKDHLEIIRLCHQLKPERICLEATGGYQTSLLLALAEEGLPVSLVNPKQVRHFAKGFGKLVKTDQVDAEVLALFARQVTPRITVVPSFEQQQLSALIRRREQLTQMLTAEKNRFSLAHQSVKQSVEQSIKWLEQQLRQFDDEIDTTFKNSSVYKDAQLLESIPGLARISSLALLAELPELGKISNKEIASLAGLAPFTQSSGTWRGKDRIQQGRRLVRKKLYMAAFNTIRYNPVLKQFYERLREKGKPFKVAIVAVMRKLLCICNSMLKYQRTWKPDFA